MYLDTANVELINEFIDFDWVQGVTTNPTLLKAEKGVKREETITQLTEVLGGKELFVQVQGKTLLEMENDAKNLLGFGKKQLALKIQVDEKGLRLIQKIKSEHPDRLILGTVIFSVEQAYLAGIAGCDWIAPYVNRMENQGIRSDDVIQNSQLLFQREKKPTKIMGASFKNHAQITRCLLSGATTVTVPPALMKSMMNNQLASKSIDVFNEDSQLGEII